MANIKSAKKRVLTNESRRQRNKAKRSRILTEVRKLLSMKDPRELKAHLSSVVYPLLDRAPRQVMHPNKASRLKKQAARIVKRKSGV